MKFPMRPARCGPVAVVIAAGGLLLLGLACQVAGVRFNSSPSIAVGVYRATEAPIEKGSHVLACPPPGPLFALAKARHYLGAGFCPGSFGYLMKRVVAMQDDRVTVADEGVRINGTLLPASAPRQKDRAGRPMPYYRIQDYVLGRDELLLMSDGSPTGFDGRYFGPLHRSQVQLALTAVMTW